MKFCAKKNGVDFDFDNTQAFYSWMLRDASTHVSEIDFLSIRCDGKTLIECLNKIGEVSFPNLSEFNLEVTEASERADYAWHNLNMPNAKIHLSYFILSTFDVYFVATILRIFNQKITTLSLDLGQGFDVESTLSPDMASFFTQSREMFLHNLSYCTAIQSLSLCSMGSSKEKERVSLFKMFLSVLDSIPNKKIIDDLSLACWSSGNWDLSALKTVLFAYDRVKKFATTGQRSFSALQEVFFAYVQSVSSIEEFSFCRCEHNMDMRDLLEVFSIPHLRRLHIQTVCELDFPKSDYRKESMVALSARCKQNMTLKAFSLCCQGSYSRMSHSILEGLSYNQTIEKIQIQCGFTLDYMRSQMACFLDRETSNLKNPCLRTFSHKDYREPDFVELFPAQIEVNKKFVNFLFGPRHIEKKIEYFVANQTPEESERRMLALDKRVYFLMSSAFHQYQKKATFLPFQWEQSDQSMAVSGNVFKDFTCSLAITACALLNDDWALWMHVLSYLDYPSVEKMLDRKLYTGLFFCSWSAIEERKLFTASNIKAQKITSQDTKTTSVCSNK